MSRLKQTFTNSTDQSFIICLELSTSRYRLSPGEQLTLFYDSDDTGNGPDMPLQIEFGVDGTELQVIVWTGETSMYLPDGTCAPMNYDLK